MRRALFTVVTIVTAAALAACVGNSSTGPRHAVVYAVLLGHVNAPNGTGRITVSGQAYTDTNHAKAQDSLYGGFSPTIVDGNNNYFLPLATQKPVVLYFNLQAQGLSLGKMVVDSVRLVRLRFDSLGGGPHDSVVVNFNLH